MQVGLWVHRASLQLSGIFLSPTSELLNAVTVLNSIFKTVHHLDCRSSTEPVGVGGHVGGIGHTLSVGWGDCERPHV